MEPRQLPRVLRTIWPLHWSQISIRAWKAVQRRAPKIRPDRPLEVPGIQPGPMAMPPVFGTTCDSGNELIESLAGGKLRLLNQSFAFGESNWDWRLGSVSEDRLWTVTLHYHQWLYELAKIATESPEHGPKAKELWGAAMSDWLQNCRLDSPGAKPLVWNAYAIATRLSWSIRTWQLWHDAKIELPQELLQEWQKSLYQQADHLYRNLEWDLRANHLLRDAVGLAWAANFFVGSRSRQWLAKAQQIAVQQSEEQMLPDGGHFERSPFYHLEVMDDWLTLAILFPAGRVRDQMRETWQRAAEYARWLRHPDGCVAQFNDGATINADQNLIHGEVIGVDVDLSMPRGGKHFSDSGVAVWHGEPWTLFWDVGDVGPNCQPGHAHADTLSLECSFRAQKLFVDPGCYSYDYDRRREYDRATSTHNTVCIDQTDSSEVWHIFRVGRRARPRGIQVSTDQEHFLGQAEHDGYQHLAGRPVHRRIVEVSEEGFLIVTDQVDGLGTHQVEGGWLLAPHWKIRMRENRWELTNDKQILELEIDASSRCQIDACEATYHPEYGVEIATKRLRWKFEGKLPFQIVCRVSEVSKPLLG
ncbi:Heparin-sulfate lyase precursor [Roseimaritima multifibrata]|uniref:Heparin-sulfate lyase n=2 Tax=Roseimaritima multifibrata TaxID=1930274 RepID=A0A517MLN3_9BACT|nr:Heparin-sulfate lyase precursor [Roseimaritima multifibrata]